MRGHRIATAAALGLLLGLAGPARADVIIRNLTGVTSTFGTFLNSPLGFPGMPSAGFDSAAAGFTMPAGTGYTLDSVGLHLTIFSANTAPVVAVFDTNPLGNPGVPLVTLTSPAVSVGPAVY